MLWLCSSFLSDTVCSAAVIETSYCALKWVHELRGVPIPVACSFLKSIVEAAKRKHAKPAVKKELIFSDTLHTCCSKYQQNNDFTFSRGIAMSLLLYAGFLRLGEISSPRVNDLMIKTSEKSLTQRFDDSIHSSFSSEKRIKFDNLIYIV